MLQELHIVPSTDLRDGILGLLLPSSAVSLQEKGVVSGEGDVAIVHELGLSSSVAWEAKRAS